MYYVDRLEEISSRYVPTGELREPTEDDIWLTNMGVVQKGCRAPSPRIILRRVEKEKEIEIDGKKYSESTIKNALREYVN